MLPAILIVPFVNSPLGACFRWSRRCSARHRSIIKSLPTLDTPKSIGRSSAAPTVRFFYFVTELLSTPSCFIVLFAPLEIQPESRKPVSLATTKTPSYFISTPSFKVSVISPFKCL
jgi:hypothetical protein